MSLQLKTIQQFVQDAAAVLGLLLNIAPPLASGGAFNALLFAAASQWAFLLANCQYVVNFARFQTSYGPDADSWGAQFGFFRLEGVQAQGTVQLSIPVAQGADIAVPPGVVIQSQDGTIVYALIADPTQASWSAQQEAYILPAGQNTINATAQATEVGTSQNVQANLLTQFGGPSFGIQTVNNSAAIVGGENAESDPAYKARFVLYINSLSEGTEPAISLAVQDAVPGLNYALLENLTPSLTTLLGYFTAVLNNPGGAVTAQQISAVQAAVENVRAYTIQFNVIAAILEQVTIYMNIRVAAGFIGITESVIIGGTKTTSDILTLIVHDSGLPGGEQSLPYTVQSGDTLSSIAAGLTALINANTYLAGLGITAISSATAITIVSNSPNLTTYTRTLSSLATETMTLSATGSVENAVQAAVIAFVNNLPIGATLYLSDLMQVAMNAAATGVILAVQYSSLTINGSQSDYTVTAVEVPQTSTLLTTIGRF